VLSGFNTGSEQKPIALLDFFFRNIRN
jgi:hypothetical protein